MFIMVSSDPHLSHVVNVNMMSSVKIAGHLFCQFWRSLANASRAAQCWAVNLCPSEGHQDVMAPSWSLRHMQWADCWSSFCGVHLLPVRPEWADTGRAPSSNLSSAPCAAASLCVSCTLDTVMDDTANSTYRCVILEELWGGHFLPSACVGVYGGYCQQFSV